MKKSILILGLLVAYNAFADNKHQHGHAKIEVESKRDKIDIDFKAPALDVLGFEHRPNTQEEKAKLTEIKNLWNNQALNRIIVIDENLECKVTKKDLEFDAERFNNEDHGNIEGKIDLKCNTPVAGKNITLKIKELFPNVKNIHYVVEGSTMTTKESTDASVTLSL